MYNIKKKNTRDQALEYSRISFSDPYTDSYNALSPWTAGPTSWLLIHSLGRRPVRKTPTLQPMALSSYLLAGSRAASPSLPSFPSLRRRRSSHHCPPSLVTTPLPLPPAQRWRRSLRFCASSSSPPPMPPEDEEDYEVPNSSDVVLLNFYQFIFHPSAVSSSLTECADCAPQESSIQFTSLMLYLNEFVCSVARLFSTPRTKHVGLLPN